MTHFVAKPVARDLLFQALESALTGASEPAAPQLPVTASEQPIEDPAVDTDAIEVLIGALGHDRVVRMVEIFCAETRERLSRLADGGPAAASLREEMHALKGAAATVGAPRLSRLAAKAEAGLDCGLGDKVANLADMSAAFDAYANGLTHLKLTPALAA
jgi:HPt (histidine-containing phosphotransfer) domain-containing protein